MLFDAYVEGGAARFFAGHPSRPEDRARAVRRAERPLDAAVAAALRAQQARLAPSAARDAHLAALEAGASAVVTGQQAGLFLGPLYTIAKAATTIRVARALQEETGRPVVPVFWVQAEDHDLPEIAEVGVPSGAGLPPLRVRLPASADNRISVAHLTLPPEVDGALAELEAALVPLPHAAEHVAHLRLHYRPGASWADAFSGLLADLFAEEGLVIIQPRDEALGPAAAPLHRHALVHADELAARLAVRDEELRGAGFEPAVRSREGSPLSFFHPRGPAGPRLRLERAPGGYAEIGGASGVHALDELLAMLEREPLAFSTSALLRPLLQDRLLPTAACVVGPGEVAYLAQASCLYESFGLAMPLVVPRARVRVVDDGVRRLLERRGLRPDDAKLPEDEILARCRQGDHGMPSPQALEAELLGSFRTTLRRLAPTLAAAGQGLDKAIEKTEATVADAVRRLASKVEKARLHADEALVEDVRRVRQALYPGGAPQERVLGLAAFAARHGEAAFVRGLLEAIVPFDFTPRDLP